MTNWNAPFRSKLTSSAANPINSRVVIPGSKSVTNRALILAAIAKTPSRLRKPLSSRDTDLMVKGLRALGCQIDEIKTNDGFDYQITPKKLTGPTQIEVGNAGTVMRFLPPIACLANGLIHFDGDARSHERPLAPVISALEQLGVSIEHDNKYRLPITINGSGEVKGGLVEIDASASSQFVSALLLLGPATEQGITVKHTGASLPSMPHIEMTIQMIRAFGGQVEVNKNSWSVKSGELVGQDLVIEPDLSNAAPFMAAAMICGGSIEIADWPKLTTQPGDQLRDIFKKMGAKIELYNPVVENPETFYNFNYEDVDENTRHAARIKGATTLHNAVLNISDLRAGATLVLAALLAQGESAVYGIEHLKRGYEDFAQRLESLGATIKEVDEDF